MPVEWWRVYSNGIEGLLCSVDGYMASVKYKKACLRNPSDQLTIPLSPEISAGSPSRTGSSIERVPLSDLTWHEDSVKILNDVLHEDVSAWTLEYYFNRHPYEKLTFTLPSELSVYWKERENECFAWIKKYCTDPHYLCYFVRPPLFIVSQTEHNDSHLSVVVHKETSSITEDYLNEAIQKLQQEILKSIERKQKRWKLLEERGGGGSTGDMQCESVEIFAHESVVGIVMGKQGENLSRVARNHKAEIRVYPDEEGIRRIRIYGQSPRQVYDACKELDYVYRSYALPSVAICEKVQSLIKDPKGSHVKELSQINGIHSVWLKRPTEGSTASCELFICGLRCAVSCYLKTLKKLVESPQEWNDAAAGRRRFHKNNASSGWQQSRYERGTYETAV